MFIHLSHQTKFNTKQVKMENLNETTKVIGFATEYYTLWNLTKVNTYQEINGKRIHTGTTWNYFYLQNLSKNEDLAISKVTKKWGILAPEVDETLRGVTARKFSKYVQRALPADIFPFGKLMFTPISLSDDIWQLQRVYDGEGASGGSLELKTSIPLRRRVLARRRLIELGELIRCDWQEEIYDEKNQCWSGVYRTVKYMTKRNYEHKLIADKSNFLHTAGERIKLTLKEVKSTGYESEYGYVSIVTYNDRSGNSYIYKGTSKPYFPEGNEEYTEICATIKHQEYKGIKQTLLQRVKVQSKELKLS